MGKLTSLTSTFRMILHDMNFQKSILFPEYSDYLPIKIIVSQTIWHALHGWTSHEKCSASLGLQKSSMQNAGRSFSWSKVGLLKTSRDYWFLKLPPFWMTPSCKLLQIQHPETKKTRNKYFDTINYRKTPNQFLYSPKCPCYFMVCP